MHTTQHRLAGLERLTEWLLRAVTTGLRSLPLPVSYALADLAVPVIVVFTLLHERRVGRLGRGLFRNQRIVYRDTLSGAKSRKLLLAWARHMARLVVDFCRLPRIGSHNLEQCIDVDAMEPISALWREGNGLLAVSAHAGVWDLMAHLGTLYGIPVSGIVRPAANSAFDRVMSEIRTSGGARLVSKWGVLWPVRNALKRGEAIGFLADEDERRHPVFAPFLGTVAATTPVPAFLQRVTGAPIVVVTVNRVGRGRFRLHLWDVIRTTPTDDREKDLRTTTEAVNAALSRAIMAYPEQWLWGSRRFLTRPPGEVPGSDGLPPAADNPRPAH